MPLGNGDIGLNVWLEEGGDLFFYLSKTDAWDENARLLKLGRMRIALNPNPFAAGATFRQELDLARGCISVTSNSSQQAVNILAWVDANHPVVRVQVASSEPIEARASLERWRTAERIRDPKEASCPAALRGMDDRETVYPDLVLDGGTGTVLWCHRNRTSCWTDTLEHQGMGAWIAKGADPLANRTFGALLRGEGMIREGDSHLRSATAQKQLLLSIHPFTAQTDTLADWTTGLLTQAAGTDAVDTAKAFEEHVTWWREFWQRSWLRVSGTPEADVVSRGYELQRFMNACAGRGTFPIKFNGSIFTVDAREEGEVFDADYRRWGGGYWFQNTRLTYWPMIMSGDFDLMEPWFRMYRDALPFAIARARAHFGFENAAMFPETMTFWGAFLNENYGYDRGDLPHGLSENTYIRRYWQGMLELLAVLLDTHAVSGDDKWLDEYLLVLAPPFLNFYRNYFSQRDRDGKMRMAPAQALETWHEAVNPTPDVAGLQWVLDGLLALPQDKLPAALREQWKEFRNILPPLPTRTYVWEKRTEIIPALEYDQCANFENPELYAVFPYRLFGVGQPNLETGVGTWQNRCIKRTGGWYQDAIQAALLGLTEEAQRDVVKNLSTSHSGSRFPAFWGPNFDWIPDQDHGSVACIALQRMLMQWERPSAVTAGTSTGGAIHLLPAWPKEWNADFRLHAPGGTVLRGRVENGKIPELHVSPESRRAAVLD